MSLDLEGRDGQKNIRMNRDAKRSAIIRYGHDGGTHARMKEPQVSCEKPLLGNLSGVEGSSSSVASPPLLLYVNLMHPFPFQFCVLTIPRSLASLNPQHLDGRGASSTRG